MSASSDDHDRLAWRLTAILLKLNQGERVVPDDLAAEFGVHPRTIRRDLHERFAFLPLEKDANGFRMDAAYLGKLSFTDMERFAGLAGLRGLFPALDTQFFRELFDSRIQDTLSIHGSSFEDLGNRVHDFRTLQRAITQRHVVRFDYRKDNQSKTVDVHPYKLIHHGGIWYLAATDAGTIKAYALSKMDALSVLDDLFTPKPHLQAMLREEDSIWLNEKKTEVVLTVAAPVASYFRRRKLIAQQHIDKEMEDGGLIVSGKFAHPDQILPTVRQWIPHVRIVSPAAWQDLLETGLRNYLAGE
jgi:predicted DNA-binding transcriptional regulator YafY